MPSATSGFTGAEIISYAQTYIGNQDSSFQSFLESTLALAEFQYCKGHDWSFLNKQNLSLTVATGTDEYTLSVANLGYYMQADQVKRIFSVTHNRVLVKKTLDELRLMDPDQNDGTTTTDLQYWAPVGDNTIVVWPKAFSDTVLKVDGKITPAALLTTSNYPTVPFHYQNSFIAYFIGMALERENDDRAAAKKQEAAALMQADIQNDQAALSNSGGPRFRSVFEDPNYGAIIPQVDPLNMVRG